MDPGRGELDLQSTVTPNCLHQIGDVIFKRYLVQKESSGVGAEHFVINIHHQFLFTRSTLDFYSIPYGTKFSDRCSQKKQVVGGYNGTCQSEKENLPGL